jgi:RimJ/RimL family protein N-acetyltransferase
MIGTDRVTLVPANKHWRVYRRLWWTLLANPDAPLLFGVERPRIPSWLDRAWTAMFGESGQWECHRFVIEIAGKSIGVADIHEDRPNSVCFLVLGLLPKYRGKKLGTVAARLMLRKSFEDLGARRVESSVISSNTASLRMRDGMIQEGILKDRCVVGSKTYDEVLFRLLKSEWENQLLATAQRRAELTLLESK